MSHRRPESPPFPYRRPFGPPGGGAPVPTAAAAPPLGLARGRGGPMSEPRSGTDSRHAAGHPSAEPVGSGAGVPPGKLTPPPLGFPPLSRPRPLRALSRSVATSPVTLLSGPAGTGKTGRAASWAQEAHERPPVAWLSLDAADDDPATFWPCLLAALD